MPESKYSRLSDMISEGLKKRRKKSKKNRPVPHYTGPDLDYPEAKLEPLEERAKRFARERAEREAKKEKAKAEKKEKKAKDKPKKKKKKKDSMKEFFEARDELDIPFD